MNWKILSYRFEVERSMNNDEGFIKADSLNSALTNMTSDGWLRVIYELQIEDRITTEYKIELPYEDVAQLNEQQTLNLIEQDIKIKFNQ